MFQQDDEVFGLFIQESKEHLESIEEDLLSIEEAGADVSEDLINKVFRAAHTIKGGSGFFGLEKVKELAHTMENILGLIRARELVPSPEVISSLLAGADMLRQMIANPQSEAERDIRGLVDALKNSANPNANAAGHAETTNSADTSSNIHALEVKSETGTLLFTVNEETMHTAQKMEKGGSFIYLLKYQLLQDIQRKNRNPWDVIQELTSISYFIDSCLSFEATGTLENMADELDLPLYILCATVLEPALMADCLGLPNNQVKVMLAKPLSENPPIQVPAKSVEAAPIIPTQANTTENTPIKVSAPPNRPTPSAPTSTPIKNIKEVSDSTVRVHLTLLDKLMTLAGELVLTRNELLQNANERNLDRLIGTSQRVDTITSDLQEAIMATRMQSVGIVFNKFKRVVHDLSRDLGKKVQLVIEGEEVEMDKTIIEAIGDPMTHLVRNSVDHGIEMPDARKKKGKSEEGRLELKAFHEAGQVVIEINDDGKGIDTKRVREKAIEKGMMSAVEAQAMSEKDVVNLIFAPGFSTAEKVTDVSGRGVGMDVVSSNLQSVGGVIDISTRSGEGTTIRIKLPLTLAIIPSLLVSIEDDRFAIPQVNLLELVRIPAKDIKRKIETIGSASVMRLRGELLPLVRLKEVLGVNTPTYIDAHTGERVADNRKNIADRRQEPLNGSANKSEDPRNGMDRRGYSSTMQIAIVTTGDFTFGLIVDALLDTEEIVVKPLGTHLSQIQEYAGATILGDGNVAFILDISGICTSANLLKHQSQIDKRKKEAALRSVETDKQSLLLVRNSENEKFTIPLSLVTRIEKISHNQILTVGGKRAMTYRGKSLLLFKVEDVAKVDTIKDSLFYFVVVYIVGGREVGLVVSEILDILKTDIEVDDVTHKQNGIVGSVVLDGTIVLMLDIYGIADLLAPDLIKASKKQEEENNKKTILLVEDSAFFLNQMKNFVEKAGFNVMLAEDGRKGLATLENSEDKIDLILTDIEMPNMNGLEMTRAIRANSKWKSLPIIAVTSVAGEDAERAGKIAGIDEYLIKLDREQILSTCHRILNPTQQLAGVH